MAFSFGFGSKKGKSSTTTTEQTDTTREQTQTGTQATTGTQQEQVTTLSPEVQELLTGLVMGAGGQVGDSRAVEQAQQLSDLLAGRAATADTARTEDIAAIVAEQERAGRAQIDRLFTDLSQQIGSSQGSLVRQAAAEGEASLASQLAGTRGQLNLQARDAATQELLAALGAQTGAAQVTGAETANLATLTNLLKGATTAGTTTTQQQVTTEQQLLDVIKSLTTGTTSTTSKSSGFNLGF